eukprot:GILJ01000112.1.p2 GENE.GILJ01000112.1~~GILJ01000112.1.p2  ORF type:complete len:295 (-),score=62.35 GILJ01000112.1:1782-2666(-)
MQRAMFALKPSLVAGFAPMRSIVPKVAAGQQYRFAAVQPAPVAADQTASETNEVDIPPRIASFANFMYQSRHLIYASTAVSLALTMSVDSRVLYLGSFAGTILFLEKMAGPHITAYLDEAMQKKRTNAYSWKANNIRRFNTMLGSLQFRTTLTDDMQALQEYTAEMLIKTREAKAKVLQYQLHQEALKHLMLVQKFEDQKIDDLQRKLVANATKHVTDAFTSGDAKLRAAALQRSIDILASKKTDKDPVQSLFKDYLGQAKKQSTSGDKNALSLEEQEVVHEFLENLKRKAAAH